jgi:ABC-2 type transport system ATP-binding protein
LALALCARPKIAFLDEPTSGVDVDGRQEIRSIIRELAGEGCAVVLATHEMDEAERCADNILIMDRGKVVADGALAALQEPETRFRLSLPIATKLLSDALGSPVAMDGSDYVLIGRSGTDVIAALAEVARKHGTSVVDVRSGTQRLETLFRRFTEEHGS